MYLPWPSYAHALYFTEIASYIHSSEAGCIIRYALVYCGDCYSAVAEGLRFKSRVRAGVAVCYS